MRLWQKIGRQQSAMKSARGVSQAVLENASREELCAEVHQILRHELIAKVDRFGVWLAPVGESSTTVDPQSFRGRFWDAVARADVEDTLLEWNVLGSVGCLPEELLTKLAPTEEDVASRVALTMAAVAGMRRALWVPVLLDEQLYGVLFAASRQKNVSLPREVMTRVAAELAVALGFEKRSASLCGALGEQAFQRKVLAEIAEGASLDRVLQEIVNSSLRCATGRKSVGPFAMIGLPASRPRSGEVRGASLDFRWTAGDRLWARSAMSEPISSTWQEALATRRMTGREIRAPWSYQDVARIVAIPLFAGTEILGVFVAGLQNSSANLATLERLEMRAGLAGLALDRSRRSAAGATGVESVRFFVDHAAEPWFVLDAKFRVAHASEPGRKLLSLPQQSPAYGSETPDQGELRSLGTAAQLFEPAEWQRLVGWMRKISRNEGNSDSHSVDAHLRKGGFVRLHGAPLPGGGLSLLMQRPREEQSSESHAAAELRSLMEWLDHGVLVFGEHDHVQAANPAFSQFFGLSASEIEGSRSLREMIATIAPRVKEPERFAERWWDSARGIDGGREEIQITQPAPRTLERISGPVLNRSGSRIGRIEIYRDATGQQMLETKLRKNERLVSLGEKVSGIAHELSNPLTTIFGYAQRLLAKTDGPARREEIQHILAEAERASSIVRQLLSSTNESAPDLRPLSLNELVQRTVDAHRFQLASEKIRVELDLAESLPQMLGDAGQLQQILLNLIANARHALLELQRPGTISFRTNLADSGRILLEVSDSGPGIPEALRHRIFDPFFTTKPAGIGSGLGLSIVAGLVRQHAGHIRLNSSARRGASFLLDFPPAAADVPTLLSKLPPALSVAPVATARGERVLVVEDEQTVAQLIADMLSDLGYTCEVQQDARRALISALNRDYELVVCDIKMPGLDGPHFYRALLEAGSSLTARFLFVTGDVLGAGTQEFLRQFGLPYIAKPFRVEEFTEKIALVLHEAASPAGTTSHNSGLRRKNLVGHG